MGNPSDASLSSSSSDDSRHHKRHRSDRSRRRDRHHRRHKHNKRQRKSNNNDGKDEKMMSLPAASSDWDELRAHFQFVLPTDNDYGDGDGDGAVDALVDSAVGSAVGNTDSKDGSKKYGSTWQERMVQHYHSHLYKEYVLADLSRVYDLGKVGLRWRTAEEVANGKGFRCCGNLLCQKSNNSTADISLGAVGDGEEEKDAYCTAARRHMGIGIAENGGKEPMGIVLPTTSEEVKLALESYLQSCAEERQNLHEGVWDEEYHKKKHGRKSKHHRKRHRRRDNKPHEEYSIKEQERTERKRLARLPFGIGLHDYEVDFVYVERGERKRELVKVRLCLRCAPLLFVAKMKDANRIGDHKTKEGSMISAVKAREARENAARSHRASMMMNAQASGTSDSLSQQHDNHAKGILEDTSIVKNEHSEIVRHSRVQDEVKKDGGSNDDSSGDRSRGSRNHRRRTNHHRRNREKSRSRKRRCHESSSSLSSFSSSEQSR